MQVGTARGRGGVSYGALHSKWPAQASGQVAVGATECSELLGGVQARGHCMLQQSSIKPQLPGWLTAWLNMHVLGAHFEARCDGLPTLGSSHLPCVC